LPKISSETPAMPGSVGIDGVSLGGRAALLAGFDRPDAFKVVASLQAAIDRKEVHRFVARAERALKSNPKLSIRLLTSQHDYFRREIELLAQALTANSVPHTFTLVAGDHSYAFNRGPGAFEMLTFHHWALRGKPHL